MSTFPFRSGFRGSWIGCAAASSDSASSAERYTGSGSYSTWIRSSARFAVSSSIAATAATASPMNRTLSTQSACSSRVHGMIP